MVVTSNDVVKVVGFLVLKDVIFFVRSSEYKKVSTFQNQYVYRVCSIS